MSRNLGELMEEEYNELTKRLLAAGVTVDNYDRTKYRLERDRLDNYYGGFEYQRFYCFEFTYKTPCGLYCKGSQLFDGLSYNGTIYKFENDNPLARCPYSHGGKDCNLISDELKNLNFICRCVVKKTDEKYDYENSIEHKLKVWDDEVRRKKLSFIMQSRKRICENHMYFDKDEEAWKYKFSPINCTMEHCPAQRGAEECPIVGRMLDKKRGNVYYDIKIVSERRDLRGTLFEGEESTQILKGNRAFKKPMSMDICRMYANLCQDWIRSRVRSKYSRELFFAERGKFKFEVETLNIRAAQKDSRDLEQDIQDIQDGIQVLHISELEKEKKELKKEKSKEAQEKRIEKLEQKILKYGYDSFEKHSLDKNHADRWLGEERIAELEFKRDEIKEAKKNEPEQMSLFDL